MQSLRAIGLVLFALVLLPASVFLAYEISALDENEQLMQDIYVQQLETLLFSINQQAWDVTDAWADQLSLAHAADPHNLDQMEAAARQFLADQPAVGAVMLSDSLRRNVRWIGTPGEAVEPTALDVLETERLFQQRRAGYRRIEPVAPPGRPGAMLLLVFVPDAYRDSPVHLIGLAVDKQAFVQRTLVPRLQETARSTYRVGLFRDGDETAVYETATPGETAFRRAMADQTRPLWVLPDYAVGIRPVGASISEMVRQRFLRNLAMVAILVVCLLAAAYAVYRSIRRQVALARMKSDFVSNVSHELRTPLALIRMYTETLEMGRIPDEERRMAYLRVISQEAERLTHLVNHILNFSRMEAGRKTYASAPVDLNEVVETVFRLYEPTLGQQGFTITPRLAPDLPLLIGDRDALTEALVNLIDNAVKYSRDDRRITIETGTETGGVFVAVEDHGIGIAAADQRRVFEKFYRVSTGLVHQTRGTGLGLAIVDHIVRSHGGRVVLRSAPGEGSRFSLHLPAAPAGMAVPGRPAPSHSTSSLPSS